MFKIFKDFFGAMRKVVLLLLPRSSQNVFLCNNIFYFFSDNSGILIDYEVVHNKTHMQGIIKIFLKPTIYHIYFSSFVGIATLELLIIFLLQPLQFNLTGIYSLMCTMLKLIYWKITMLIYAFFLLATVRA